jgi:putative RecB family exonuclease
VDTPLFPLSYSKLSSYDQCRKKYWYGYVERTPRPRGDSPAGMVGTGVHRAMKALCDTGDAKDGRHELDAYLRMAEHAVAAPGTPLYAEAMELYEAGVAAHNSIHSERRWPELDTYVPYRGGGVSVSARLDRADFLGDNRWQIIDWKTGRFDFGEATDAQLDIAHAALRTVHNLPIDATVTAIGWNLRTGDRRVRNLVRDDAAATLHYLARRAKQLQETTVFEATPSRACSFCDWRAICPDAAQIETAVDEWLGDDEPEVIDLEGQ